MGMFFHSPEERWERIVQVLLWVAGLFGAFTIYGIYSGDDWRGLVMTILPGLLCLGLWYAARVRLDHMASGTPAPAWVRIVGWTFAAGGVATVGWIIYGLSTGYLEYRDPEADRREREQEMLKGIKLSPAAFKKLSGRIHASDLEVPTAAPGDRPVPDPEPEPSGSGSASP